MFGRFRQYESIDFSVRVAQATSGLVADSESLFAIFLLQGLGWDISGSQPNQSDSSLDLGLPSIPIYSNRPGFRN